MPKYQTGDLMDYQERGRREDAEAAEMRRQADWEWRTLHTASDRAIARATRALPPVLTAAEVASDRAAIKRLQPQLLRIANGMLPIIAPHGQREKLWLNGPCVTCSRIIESYAPFAPRWATETCEESWARRFPGEPYPGPMSFHPQKSA